jgi:hypothetical protein
MQWKTPIVSLGYNRRTHRENAFFAVEQNFEDRSTAQWIELILGPKLNEAELRAPLCVFNL